MTSPMGEVQTGGLRAPDPPKRGVSATSPNSPTDCRFPSTDSDSAPWGTSPMPESRGGLPRGRSPGGGQIPKEQPREQRKHTPGRDTMSTAKNKTGHGAAWANLIVCGGISWAVSLWHATHATTSGNKFLAVLAATAPVVTAAFASHHVAKKGVKLGKRVMTCIVFVMGMALSVKAQAQSIGPIVGGVELGVVFALMLDVSTFLALSSIMSKPATEAPAEDPAAVPVTAQDWSLQRSQDRAITGPQDRTEAVPGPVPATVQDRSQDHGETVLAKSQDRSPKRSQSARRTTPKSGAKTGSKGRVTQAEWENKIRKAVAENPDTDLNPAPIAALLGLDSSTRASGGFKRAVSVVRAELDGADHRLRAVNE